MPQDMYCRNLAAMENVIFSEKKITSFLKEVSGVLS